MSELGIQGGEEGRKRKAGGGQRGRTGDLNWWVGIPIGMWEQSGNVLVSETPSVYSYRQEGIPTTFLLSLCWSRKGLDAYRAG